MFNELVGGCYMTRDLPLIIEFTGLPNSGKTTLIHNLTKILEEKGFKVKIMQEDAELVPKEIPKKTWIRNVWITFGQLQSLLEIPYLKDYDIVFLDRGFYDAVFWANFLYVQNVCSKEQSDSLLNILEKTNDSFNLKPDVLFVVNVSVDESIRRRFAMKGEKPLLTNLDFLNLYQDELNKFYDLVLSPIVYLDTTNMTITEVCSSAYEKIKHLI